MKSFTELELNPYLLQTVAELGYEKLTPIQAQSIPLLLEGRDLVGQSKTGSGKTAAFTLPILQKLYERIEKIPKGQRAYPQIQALVLCPTRELCTQVAREIRKLGRHQPGLQVQILAGGQPIFLQLNALEKGCHIVAGTPGRVLDHLKRKTVDFSQVSFVVLDEADRMLDMGFQADMEKILKTVPKTRQTIFFSATFPSSIEAMSKIYQQSPMRVTIEEAQQSSATAPAIKQVYYETAPDTKLNALLWLLQQNQLDSAIVFCNLKATVVDLNHALAKAGVSACCIHGDLEQSERDRVMAKFRNKSARILVATDVAARGLDVENLDGVFNYDLPSRPEVYVHRIGRTGRAGKKGLAISLVTPREKGKILGIEKYTGVRLDSKTMASTSQLEAEVQKTSIHKEAAMETLFISGGRKDKMRPGDILGALTGEAGGLKGSEIGKIEIHDRFSYVAVSKAVAQLTLQKLRNGRIKGRKFRIESVR